MDSEAMSDLFRRALSIGDKLELAGLKIVDVRYRPGKHCELLYRLKLRDPVTRDVRRELIRAELLRIDEYPTPPEELLARYEVRAEKAIRESMVYLPETQMVVYPFPIDPGLPWLFDALDPATMKHELNRLLLERGFRVLRTAVQVLSYTPRARAALLYEAFGEAEASGRQEPRKLVGKMHYSRPAASRFANGWALWRAAEGRIGLAPPVGYSKRANLTLHELVEGERLRELVNSPSALVLVRNTASALATLHSLKLPLSRTRRAKTEADAVRRAVDGLAAACPALAGRLTALRERLTADIETHTQVTSPVHGDFHPSNVMVDGDQITFIDLDSIAHGDPIVDVGRFLGSLRMLTALTPVRREGLEEPEQVFLDAYSDLADVDMRRLRLFEASEYLRSAADSSRRRANWRERAAVLVEQAERAWHSAASVKAAARTSAVFGAFSLVGDRMRWATDEVYMQAALTADVQQTYNAELRACQIVAAQRSEQNARLSYLLSGSRDGEPWSLVVEGCMWHERRGRSLFRTLTMLRPTLQARPELPLLPSPVGHLRTLSMLVVEPPTGRSLSTLAGRSDRLGAASRVARALAAFHNLDLDIDDSRSLNDELLALGAQVERLGEIRSDLSARTSALFLLIDGACRVGRGRIAPVLGQLPLDQVLCQGERVAVRRLDDLALSEPLFDVGSILAQLGLMGVEGGNLADVAPVAERLRDTYVTLAGATEDRVAAFEAAALLRLACTSAESSESDAVVSALLTLAEASVAAAQRG